MFSHIHILSLFHHSSHIILNLGSSKGGGLTLPKPWIRWANMPSVSRTRLQVVPSTPPFPLCFMVRNMTHAIIAKWIQESKWKSSKNPLAILWLPKSAHVPCMARSCLSEKKSPDPQPAHTQCKHWGPMTRSGWPAIRNNLPDRGLWQGMRLESWLRRYFTWKKMIRRRCLQTIVRSNVYLCRAAFQRSHNIAKWRFQLRKMATKEERMIVNTTSLAEVTQRPFPTALPCTCVYKVIVHFFNFRHGWNSALSTFNALHAASDKEHVEYVWTLHEKTLRDKAA